MLSDFQLTQATAVLRAMCSADENVDACALITNDGHVLTSTLPTATDPDRLGAMSASLLALATRASEEIRRGPLQLMILEGTHGIMLLTRAGPHCVLAVASKTATRLGKVIFVSRAAATRLAALTPV